MLRNRSRTFTTKQSLMADHNSVPSSKPKQTTPISSFFGSPRFFSKGVTNFETVVKPTSILDSPRFSNIFGFPFGYYDPNMPKFSRVDTEKKQFSETNRIGLALVNSLIDENSPDHILNFTNPNNCTRVQLASKLKSPGDFGNNTTKLQFSDDLSISSGLNYGVEAKESPNISTACLSWSEMELSEDYTCVISYGPNPKTTRIFDNCIVERCCGVLALSDLRNEYNLSSPSQSFLSSCHTCKKNIGQGKDIYMYRGEKAFCSNECRCEEMFLDEKKNSEMDNGF